jgi:hypothetical protein
MSIDRYSKIRRTALSEEFYLQSLLQEAHVQGEISDAEVEGILAQCVNLLAANTQRYNRGESSSIRIEAAQGIMASDFYTIGLYLKSLPDPHAALESIRRESVSEIYRRSRGIIDSKLSAAEELYQFVRDTRIPNPNYTYNATIEEGIEGFFGQYDPDFAAHETPASIDYQLLNPVADLAGVEYMIRYLQSLYMENLLCSRFDSAIIDEVMRGYDEAYEDLLVNICGQVLQNALGCALLGRDLLSLSLGAPDVRRLKDVLAGNTGESICDLLRVATETLLESLGVRDPSLEEYIHASLPEIASRIRSAVETDTLHSIFVHRRARRTNVIKYSTGAKMDDEAYRDIVGELLSCRYSQDKIEIIKEHVKTLSDIEDIITDGDLCEKEALTVFGLLGDVDLAVLLKRHPHSPDIEEVGYPESEMRLRQYLEKYLERMPESRLRLLKRTASEIEEV